MIEPISIDDVDLGRPPEVGRLRLGERGSKGQPVKLSTWRATSDDEQAIVEFAEQHGGTPRRWQGAPVGEQWEVISTATALDVLIPPGMPSAFLEAWKGGGLLRRCNGTEAEISTKSDGMVLQGCWCAAQGLTPDVDETACSLTVRFSVILPDISGLGVWRVDTGSQIAFRRLAQQFAMLRRTGANSTDVPAQLLARSIEIKKPGQTKKQFVIPELRLRRTYNEVRQSVAELDAGEQPRQLESARSSTIADKPIHVQELIYACGRGGLDADQRHALVHAVSGGRTASSREVTVDEATKAIGLIEDGTWSNVLAPLEADPPPSARDRHLPGGRLSDDERRELQRLRVLAANLPTDLQAKVVDQARAKGIVEDLDDMTSEQLAVYSEIVEAVDVERLERVAAAADRGDTPPTAEEWAELAREAGFNGNRILKEARTFAAELGVEQPRALDEITNDSLVSRLMGWLREQGLDLEGSAA